MWNSTDKFSHQSWEKLLLREGGLEHLPLTLVSLSVALAHSQCNHSRSEVLGTPINSALLTLWQATTGCKRSLKVKLHLSTTS